MKKNMNLKIYFWIIPILLIILFLSIGYSAFVDSMSITGAVVKVRPEKFTRITAVTTNSSSISNLDYNMTEILGEANIAANESITFNITITTFASVKAALSDIKVYDGNNIISNVDITPDFTDPDGPSYIKICNTSNVCTLNAPKQVTITITNNTGSIINTNNFKIALTFTPFYTVTYNNSVIGDVLSGDTFTYNFTSTPPTSVTVDSGTCGEPQIQGSTLTIPNVTSDIKISSSSGSGEIVSGEGTSGNPYISNSNTYNPSPNDLPTGYISYDSVNGKPQIIIENVNGVNQITSVEFKDNSGVAFGSSGTLDTKFNAFVGDTFTIDMTFDANLGNEVGNYILSAFEESNGVYNGFSLRVASSTSLIISTYLNVRKSNGTLTPTYNSSATRIIKSNGIYSLQITYDKYGYNQGGNKYARLAVIAGQTRNLYNNSSDSNRVPTSLTNATVSLNGNGIDNADNMTEMTVYTFKVPRN